MIQHIDLFSGIGGFALAGRMAYGEQWNTVAFCEIDKGCQAVLNKRFQGVEIHKDITKLNGIKHNPELANHYEQLEHEGSTFKHNFSITDAKEKLQQTLSLF